MENSGDVLLATPLLQPVTLPQSLASEIKLASSCPWSKIKAVEAVSLNDVMSEQLATSLVEEDAFVPIVDVPV